MNPFDLAGPVFLLFFVAGFAMTAALRRGIERFALGSRKGYDASVVGALDHYEVAYLSGGPRAAVDAAVAVLLHQQRIVYERRWLVPTTTAASSVKIAPGIYREVAVPFSEHPLEQAVQRVVVANGRIRLRRLRRSVHASEQKIAERLTRVGLVIATPLRTLGFVLGVVPLYLLILAGIIKSAIGISHDKPVGILILLLIAALTYAVFKHRFRFPLRTINGDRALEALRRKNSALYSTAVYAPQQLHAHEAALGYALFGSAVLASSFAELGADIQQLGSGIDDDLKAHLAARPSALLTGSSSSSSGCSAASCSGSSCGGGGCGGGGCGGGCGGCGG